MPPMNNTSDEELAKYLYDAATMRAANQRKADREALELRFMMDGEVTQEIVTPHPLTVNVGWRLRLAQLARRVFGKGKRS